MATASATRVPSNPLIANPNAEATVGDRTFQGIGNLIRLLPTGTFFLFHTLSPVLSNYGKCHTANKYYTAALLFICSFNCFFTCFTDSYTGKDGKVRYGVVTASGLRPLSRAGAQPCNLSHQRLCLRDLVHATLTVAVFTVVAFLNPNIVRCYYPSFESTQKTLLVALPPVVGVTASTIFSAFPNGRHCIGYPPTQQAPATLT